MPLSHGLRASALALATTLAGACSVADVLSGDEILEELDEIVRIDGTAEDRTIRFRERATLSAWYMRQVLLAPIRGGLALVFGRRQDSDIDNPGEHVRELLRELPDETGADLRLCAAATSRFGWLAELAPNASTRILAIDGLAAVCSQLAIEPFAGDLDQLGLPAAADALAAARESIQRLRPERRGAAALADVTLEPYRTALRVITERPLADWATRLVLVEELAALMAIEGDPRCRPWVEDALRRAIGHSVGGALLRTIEGRARRYAEVRLCAMEQIRRLGGPRTVPLMLAAMISGPAQRDEPDYDPDELVRLRLIHYCGQLDPENARAIVRLPGRADWQARTPIDFLVWTVLNETGYYSQLRTPAIAALSWCLRRERVDPDPGWVRDYNESKGS